MTEPAPLTIAVFQCAARDEPATARLERLDAAAARAAAAGARLLVTPEAYLSGYGGMPDTVQARAEPADGPSARRAAEIARRHGLAIVLGYPEAADGVVYNAALCLGPDGSVLANHRKLGLSGAAEQATYARGGAPTGFELDGHRIAVLICYDLEFPELARSAALAGATVLVAPTALVERWPLVAHKMIPTRAFENGTYVAYANWAGSEPGYRYLGASCIAGPTGEDLARAGADEALLTAVVDPDAITAARETLPYLQDCRTLPTGS